MPKPRYFAVVPAAGCGRRFQATRPKQYVELAGRRVIDRALDSLLQNPLVSTVVVALAPGGDQYWQATDAAHHPAVQTVAGGQRRCDSVLNGLAPLAGIAAPEDWVLVHDAARPCLRAQDLARLIEELREHPCGGLLAVPVPDTLKRAHPDEPAVAETIDRQNLWQAQTPQLFRYGLLLRALRQHVPVTDEAQAMERAGHCPRLVPGCPGNFKITTADDLRLAETALRVE